MNFEDKLSAIRSEAVKNIEGRADRLLDIRNEHIGTPVAEFIERIIGWFNDSEKRLLLYQIGEYIFWDDEFNFLKKLCQFVSHEMLDDGCFIVKWMKPDYDYIDHEINGKVLKLPNAVYVDGRIRLKETDKDDPEGRPEIHYGGDFGTQDASVLLEAMDILDQRYLERHNRMISLQNRIKDLRKT